MTYPIEIDALANQMHWAKQLAQWHYNQWHHLTPWESQAQCVKRLQSHTQTHAIPTTRIALKNGKLLGSASLVLHDMKGREDLSPWLAGVYVAPDYRRQGIGTKLVAAIVMEAAYQNFSSLYLYTTGQTNEQFYLQRGWSVKERVDYFRGERVIMTITPHT